MTEAQAKHLGDTFMSGVVTSASFSEVHELTALGRQIYAGNVPAAEPKVAYFLKAGHYYLRTAPCQTCIDASLHATREQEINLSTQ